ncbi:MAG: ion channel [Methanolinea sp.]|jgi:hypothetical protein|nr:ion channel [Methanolinea sp.]
MHQQGPVHTLHQRFLRFMAWREQNKFLFLLSSIVVLLILYPVIEELVLGEWLLRILTSLVLVMGVYAVSDTRMKFLVALILAITPLVTGWLSAGFRSYPLSLVADGSSILFFVYVTVTILHSVLLSRQVRLDTVFGGITVYLLMGITFGMACYILGSLFPGSFYPDPVGHSNGLLTLSDYIYYSFSTLTTLGYGDVVPLNATARTLVQFEAICGVLYIAVLIAWLVGAAVSKSGKRREEG